MRCASFGRGARRVGVLAVVTAALAGCAMSPPKVRTTFLRSVDLIEMTDSMAQSFAGDPVIGQRSATDEPWVISIGRVVNQTNQIIPDREKWLYVGRLRAQLDQSDVSTQRSLIWIIPPERWPIVSEELGVAAEPYGLRMDPTHLLAAEFTTLTTTSGRGRTDAYLCAFELIDLGDGRVIWEDAWEVKRAIAGRTYD